MTPRDPGEAAANARSNLIRMSLVFMAVAGVIAFYVGTGRVQMNDPVELTARIAQQQVWTEDGPLELKVNITLANNTGEPIPLEAENNCTIFRWFLTDEDRNFVQAQRDEDVCIAVPVRDQLQGKHQVAGEYMLPLDTARVKPGRYILFMKYWGNELREPITID
ncbi:MAG: hypothetical protein LPK88_10350 [Alphaproteobacteria bacterium]|nr:hypothetical protein [Alphaproteobacteria bacterium]MDX5416698.1 hypothetical protein [Alphaproteobacteria bacterium]MDX5494082.1 hypothetical protein [Alphaproteobacteria bacterium]